MNRHLNDHVILVGMEKCPLQDPFKLLKRVLVKVTTIFIWLFFVLCSVLCLGISVARIVCSVIVFFSPPVSHKRC